MLGIESPMVYNNGAGGLDVDYVENTSSVAHLLRERFCPDVVSLMVEKFHQIRDLAFSYDDSDIFHSDPHPGNFLYRGEDKKILPIDSGHVIDKKLSLDILDSYLVASAFRSLIALPEGKEEVIHYTNLFKDSLQSRGEQHKVDMIINHDISVPFFARVYSIIHGYAKSVVARRPVSELLNTHYIFTDRFNSYVREELEK